MGRGQGITNKEMIVNEENIKEGLIIPKIRKSGRPKGTGPNVELIAKLRPGQSIWNLKPNEMRNLRMAAYRVGAKVKIRRQPEKVGGRWVYTLFKV